MIEDAVRTILLADAGVAAAAVGGVRTPPLPQITSPSTQLPQILLQRISGVERLNQDAQGPTTARIQVDCWASSYRAARELARRVALALNGFPRPGQHGWQGGEAVQLARMIEGSDSSDYDSEVRLHRATADYWVELAAEAVA